MLMRSAQFAVLLVFANIALASISNHTIKDVNNKLDVEAINKKLANKETKPKPNYRRKGKERSTSSSSGEKKKSDAESGVTAESLDLSSSDSSSVSGGKKKGYTPKSSPERPGWRKWHRKCIPCPEEMDLKWRDSRIKWICGAFQRARRSFKSDCMMHFRNCQDGTMFTKIHDHRCEDDGPKADKPHGDHFFYDYKVRLSDETTESDNSDSTSSEEHIHSSY